MKNWGQIYVGKELLEKVEQITECDYEINGDLVDPYRLVEMVHDLVENRQKLLEECDELVRENKGTDDLDFEYEQWVEARFLEEERD